MLINMNFRGALLWTVFEPIWRNNENCILPKHWANTLNRFVIHLKFATLSIIPVWTYKKSLWSTQCSPYSNTYILGEYEEYLLKQITSNY